MGDPTRALLFRAITSYISDHSLVSHTASIGSYLYTLLSRLSEKYPGEIQNLRGDGQGTFIAWDSPRRDEFLKLMKGVGTNVGGSGERAVRLRPMLVFGESHADLFGEACEKVFSMKR